MNKKFIFPLFVLFISSFFLLLPNVLAVDIQNNVPDTVISIYENNISAEKNAVEEFISNSSNYANYIITSCPSCTAGLRNVVFLLGNNINLDRFYVYNSSNKLNIFSGSQCVRYVFPDDLSTYTLTYKNNCENYIYNIYSRYYVLYSSFDFYYSSTFFDNNTHIVSFRDRSFTEPFLGNLKFSTIEDFYLSYYSTPPTPSDDTPLLTSFIDISIEKLAVICNFITSSYIYLAPFVIFIFYFVILLLRRFR